MTSKGLIQQSLDCISEVALCNDSTNHFYAFLQGSLTCRVARCIKLTSKLAQNVYTK